MTTTAPQDRDGLLADLQERVRTALDRGGPAYASAPLPKPYPVLQENLCSWCKGSGFEEILLVVDEFNPEGYTDGVTCLHCGSTGLAPGLDRALDVVQEVQEHFHEINSAFITCIDALAWVYTKLDNAPSDAVDEATTARVALETLSEEVQEVMETIRSDFLERFHTDYIPDPPEA